MEYLKENTFFRRDPLIVCFFFAPFWLQRSHHGIANESLWGIIAKFSEFCLLQFGDFWHSCPRPLKPWKPSQIWPKMTQSTAETLKMMKIVRVGLETGRSNWTVKLVGGFKHVLFFISYMGWNNPSHWRTPSFFKMVKLHQQPHFF